MIFFHWPKSPPCHHHIARASTGDAVLTFWKCCVVGGIRSPCATSLPHQLIAMLSPLDVEDSIGVEVWWLPYLNISSFIWRHRLGSKYGMCESCSFTDWILVGSRSGMPLPSISGRGELDWGNYEKYIGFYASWGDLEWDLWYESRRQMCAMMFRESIYLNPNYKRINEWWDLPTGDGRRSCAPYTPCCKFSIHERYAVRYHSKVRSLAWILTIAPRRNGVSATSRPPWPRPDASYMK